MRLFYRGAGYDSDPVAVDMVETGVTGKYRGQPMQFSYPRHIPVPQPVNTLNYRGVAYRTTATGSIETVKPAPTRQTEPALGSVGQGHSAFSNRRVMMEEVTKIHRQNIQRRLQHRLDVAKAKGDDLLVRQLEQEMQHIV